MRLLELTIFLGDKVIVYKTIGDDFVDIYKGSSSEIPTDILSMEIGTIGAKRKGILDIRVK